MVAIIAKIWRKILFTVLFLILIGFSLWFGVRVFLPLPEGYFLEPTYVDIINIIQPTEAAMDFTSPTPPPITSIVQTNTNRLQQTAWIPDFDFESGYASFVKDADKFDSVSPVWYSLDDNGNIVARRQKQTEIREFTRRNNIKLIPSIANFNSRKMNAFLDNPAKLNEHIQFLKNEVATYDLDGLDLDYESIRLADQPEFLKLTRELYDYLDSRGKTLSITVVSKWTDASVLNTQTRKVQDWQELGQYAHEFRIMSYTYTSYRQTYPGPVAPLDWQEANIRYAHRKVDQKKVYLGIALFGYDGWSDNPVIVEPYLGASANPVAGKGQVDSVTFTQLQKLRSPYKTNDYLEEFSQEKVMKYTFGGKQYIIFYMDKVALAPRVDLAEKYGIAGIAHWRLGGEQPGVYDLLNN